MAEVGKGLSGLARLIEQVGKDKGIGPEIIKEALVQGMLAAARKKYGTYRDIEAKYNDETGEVDLFEFKEVVKDEDFIDSEVEVKLSEALELDEGAQLGDTVGVSLDAEHLGRIAVQTVKQILIQKVRDAEKDIIFQEFEQREGEIASGIARRVEGSSIVVDLGRTEAHMPRREQIPGELFRPGDRVQGYILEVRQGFRGTQIIMSRSHEKYLMKLFEQEVPEIQDGIIQIKVAAREPSHRAKVAVYTEDKNIDPVGSCVGMKGSRVQNVIQELKGEKIDIVLWDENPAQFVYNALAPVEIQKIFMDEGAQEMEVVVADSQLSLAIGRKGQNVRLASKLTGWKIDIVSESKLSERTAESINNLMLIPGMTETMAQSFFQSGYGSFPAIAESSIEALQRVPGYAEKEKAEALIKKAQQVLKTYQDEGKEIFPVKSSSKEESSKVSKSHRMSDVETQLKQELEGLKAQEEPASEAEAASSEEPASAEKASEEKPASEAEAASSEKPAAPAEEAEEEPTPLMQEESQVLKD